MAIRPVVVSFQAEGVRDIQQAFRSVERSLIDMDRATSRSSQRASKDREKDFERSSRTISRTAQTEASAYLKNEQAKAKASARATKETEKAYERLFSQLEKGEQRAAKEHERAERQKVRESAQAARERERHAAQVARSEISAARDVERERTRAERTVARTASRESASETRVRGQYASMMGRGVNAGVGVVSNLATTALSLGGGISLADAFQSTVAARGAAATLAVQTKDGKGGGGMSADSIYRKAVEIGKATGMSSGDVIKGMDQYFAKSGDSESMLANIGDLARIARVTGSDLGELGAQAGNYQNNTKNSAQTMNWIKTTAGMGRAGSVDARELAQYGARLSSSTNEFKDKNSAFSMMSAIVQQSAATGGSSSAAEATEALVHFGTDIQKGRAEFKAKGIDVMSSDGKTLADPKQIIRSTLKQTGGDSKQLLDLFGARSYRAVSGYADVYRGASSAAKDKGLNANQANAAGLAAVDAAMGKFTDAILTETSIRVGVAERMKETDARMESALTEIRDTIGTKLVPVFADKLLPAIQSVIPAFANMVGYVADNPLKGMGILMSAAMTKEISSAMIGKVLTDAVKMNVAGQLAGGLVMGTVAAVTVGTIGKMLIDNEIEKENRKVNAAIAADIQANEAGSGLRIMTKDGKLDEKFVSKAIETRGATMSNLVDQRADLQSSDSTESRVKEGASLGVSQLPMMALTSLLGPVGMGINAVVGASNAYEATSAKETKRKSAEERLGSTIESLGKLDTAIKNATTSMTLISEAAGKGKPSADAKDRLLPLTDR